MLQSRPCYLSPTSRFFATVEASDGAAYVSSDAQVTAMLHIIPLTVVESRREVDELKELITIARSPLLFLSLPCTQQKIIINVTGCCTDASDRHLIAC